MRSCKSTIYQTRKAAFLLSLFLLVAPGLYSQIFSNSGTLGVTSEPWLYSAFGDLDNDGDYDLVASSYSSTKIFLNNSGAFTPIAVTLPENQEVINLIDFDYDGDLDIGLSTDSKVLVYSNNNLAFTLHEFSMEAGVQYTYWIDLSNDGRPEIISFGSNVTKLYSYVNGTYVQQTHNLGGFYQPMEIKQGDFNKDGWTDLIITSLESIKVFLNQKNFSFTPITIFEDVNYDYATSAIGDFNNDSYLDVIFSHLNNGTGSRTRIFLNTGNNGFYDSNIPNLPQVGGGSVPSGLGRIEVADFDGNGLDDFFVSGLTIFKEPLEIEALVYLNKGNSVFESSNDIFDRVIGGTSSVIDVNNDAKPDLFVAGYIDTKVTHLNRFYVNGNSVTPEPPSVPTGLTYSQEKNHLIIQWQPVQDDHSDHPLFNVKIGTTPTNADIITSHTDGHFPLKYTSTNAADTFKILTLSPESAHTIYASVQAIDNSFGHSAYSSPLPISILPQADFIVSKETICRGEEIQAEYYGFDFEGPTSFHWSVNGVNIDTLHSGNVTFKFQEPGLKTISLFIEDEGLISPVKSINVLVRDLAKVDFTVNNSLCQSDTTVVKYASTKVENHTFLWTVTDGVVIRNEGDTTLNVTWPGFGAKQIALQLTNTANGCTLSEAKSFNIGRVPTNSINSKASICAGETATITYTGNAAASANFNWNFDGGEIITGIGKGPYEIKWQDFGTKQILLQVTEGVCTSPQKMVTIDYYKNPKLSFEAASESCFNSNYEITYTGSSLDATIQVTTTPQYVGNGESGNSYFVKWLTAGIHNLHFKVNSKGCAKDTTITVEVSPMPPTPEICIITIDPEKSKNIVTWSFSSPVVNSFSIYRETQIAGEFILLTTVVSNREFNSYVDDQSLPSQVANRYKIAAVDTCGIETEQSIAHKTIHLSISRGQGASLNLGWNHYEGFSYSTYNIYRGTPAGGLALLTQVPSNITSYTDITPPSDDVIYQIEVVAPHSCDDGNTGRQNRVHNSSLSNIAGTGDIVTGILDIENKPYTYPNPFTEKVSLHEDSRGADYIVTDRMGKQVLRGIVNDQNEVDLRTLNAGLYILQIQIRKSWTATKILKSH